MLRNDRRFRAPSRAVIPKRHDVKLRKRMVSWEEYLKHSQAIRDIMRCVLQNKFGDLLGSDEADLLLRALDAADNRVGYENPGP